MWSIEEETCRADAIEACEVASDARSVQAETEIDSILEVRKGWEASALGRYTSSPWTLNFFLVLLTRLACVLMTMHPKFYVQSTRLSFQRIPKRIPGAALTEFFHHGGFSAERAHHAQMLINPVIRKVRHATRVLCTPTPMPHWRFWVTSFGVKPCQRSYFVSLHGWL